LPGRGIEVSKVRVGNLREAADVMRDQAKEAACLYSWNDLNRRGSAFGRGVVYQERFVDDAPSARPSRPALDVRARFPWRGWNRAFTSPILAAYGGLTRRQAVQVLPLETALFPIHGKEYYFAAFGRRGFREYQLIVPFERWPTFVGSLEKLLAASGVPITLGSLKLFEGEPALLRFQSPGICLALDAPASRKTDLLWSRLDELAIASRALVNLSKDSRLSATLLERLFPEYGVLRQRLRRFDPKRRFRSRLRDQVGV
jgi:decaprenylphospho-beta-D-ribofuranose 2-oxidase